MASMQPPTVTPWAVILPVMCPTGGQHDGSPLSGPCTQVVNAVGMFSSDIFRHVEKQCCAHGWNMSVSTWVYSSFTGTH
eukprot:11911445-Alexandrium_andersonii.AAC.1